MIAKFYLVGRISKINKHEGGIDNKGFYTCTITTKSSFNGKEKEAYHNVTFFSEYIFDKLSGIVNETLVVVEGKLSTKKNDNTGYWEPSLNGTSVETLFNTQAQKKEEPADLDDEIMY